MSKYIFDENSERFDIEDGLTITKDYWSDGNPSREDRLGLFVTSDNEGAEVAIAQSDSYVCGVTVKNDALLSGNRNLIPFPYYESSRTRNGVTFTVHPDGSIVANGTATGGRADFYILNRTLSQFILSGGQYKLSGCPDGGSAATYSLWGNYTNADGRTITMPYDYGTGSQATIPEGMQGLGIYISVTEGVTVENLTFKPVFTYSDVVDDPSKCVVQSLGVCVVKDDGTLVAGNKCMPNNDGTAKKSSNDLGYRVVGRVDGNHIKIIMAPNNDMIQRIKDSIKVLEILTDDTGVACSIYPPGYTYNNCLPISVCERLTPTGIVIRYDAYCILDPNFVNVQGDPNHFYAVVLLKYC